MASDVAVRLLEIQLDVHKRSLHEKAQRIDELEAWNIDLEAQVDHLKEVVAKHQAQSKDRLGPLADLNQPESTQEPVLPRRETLLSSSRAHPRVDPSTEFELEYPVEDPGSESDPSYEPEDEDDGHTQTSRGAFSPNPATAARLASIEPFEHGVVAKELLASTAERKAIGRRLDCKGKKTVIYRQDGTAFLFPTRKLHPYAPTVQGAPGLFFSALPNERTLSGTFQVFVGLTPGKWKYMGHYTLQRMHPLEGGEFESLPRGTKSHWVKDILEQKKYGTIRKDIHRRGIYGRAINAQDIIKALEQGEEKLFVWRMKCIGFDYNLLRQATGVPSEEGHYQ